MTFASSWPSWTLKQISKLEIGRAGDLANGRAPLGSIPKTEKVNNNILLEALED